MFSKLFAFAANSNPRGGKNVTKSPVFMAFIAGARKENMDGSRRARAIPVAALPGHSNVDHAAESAGAQSSRATPSWRRVKAHQPHIVPLSRQAAEILREIQLLSGNGRWVFPQLRNRERPMSENCITGALRALGYGGAEMSWHGFRAMASTQLHELGWNDAWIEVQLAHADRNKVGSAYNHARYLPQRRTIM